MATAHSLLSEEQLLCSICLDVFNKPVSIPCGHNFCKSCIMEYWDGEVICQCPLCKNTFVRRPDLKVNTLISELAVQFKMSVKVRDTSSSPDQLPYSIAGEVVCDICTGPKLKALKSCLECLASYCETHLEPHHRVAGLKRHNLIDPVENLEDRMCKEHNRLLTLFCREDLVFLCEVCTEAYHKTHKTVTLQQEYRERKAQLEIAEAKVEQMIQERLQELQEIKHSVKLSQREVEDQIANIVQDFTALVAFIEKSQAELIRVIEGKQKANEKEAEEIIKDLEKEITALQETGTELKHLLYNADHLHLLQNFPTQYILPETKDWSRISANSSQGMDDMRRSFKRSMSQVEFALNEIRFALNEFYNNVLSEAALLRMQQYEVDVILDPDTAHPGLYLSRDGKQVQFSNVKQRLPESSKRFNKYLAVLGKRGYSGKFYYEVQVGRKVEWRLGVVSESVKGNNELFPNPDSGFWTIGFTVDKYEAFTDPRVPVYWIKAETVGIFVDYEEGQVSFYDVENRALIYSFTGCTFTEKLYPFFNPCDDEYSANLAPLVISPVNHST